VRALPGRALGHIRFRSPRGLRLRQQRPGLHCDVPAHGPHKHADSYFDLLDELEELFARKVDLVEIEAVRNPYLRQEIEAAQETLYAAA